MADLKRTEEILQKYVRPQTFPVALKLCRSEKELPEKVRIPMRDLGHQVTICQTVGMARRYGWTIAVGKDDQCCLGGALAMGFIDKVPPGLSFPKEKLPEPGTYSHLMVSPLTRADFEPDVVVVYANSAQAMRLGQAAGMGAGLKVLAQATGLGTCVDVVGYTAKSGECQFVLPSGGDRIFGSTQDYEVVFAVPGDKLDAVMNGLEGTHKMGFRYPVMTDMNHRPALPPFLEIPKDS